ncbi:MAG: hypothetical protein ACKV2O_24540 [Acidimicrobiales bacterium]
MSDTTTENRAIVVALLTAAGLSAPPEEIDRLTQLYRSLRRQLAMVHAANVGDADPSNVFRAADVGALTMRGVA